MKKESTTDATLSKFKSLKASNLLVLASLLSISCALSSCKTPEGTGHESYKTYAEQLEDRAIINNIRERFKTNASIPSQLIHIAIDRGIVQLSGFIRTHQEADLAILTARSVSGTKDVINSLVVLSDADYAKRRGTAEIDNTKR